MYLAHVAFRDITQERMLRQRSFGKLTRTAARNEVAPDAEPPVSTIGSPSRGTLWQITCYWDKSTHLGTDGLGSYRRVVPWNDESRSISATPSI
jgi:hypothetical protein